MKAGLPRPDFRFRAVSMLAALALLGAASVQAASSPVVAWGDDAYGQCNVPSLPFNTAAVAAGYYHSLAIKDGGWVVGWGAGSTNTGVDSDYGQAMAPASLSNVVSICGGDYHTLALKRDGTLVAWGDNSYQQTNIPEGLSDGVAIAAGFGHNLTLRADGQVAAWGDNYYGQSSVPADLSRAVAISAGYAHNLALRTDGTVVAWGYNRYGQTNVPPDLTNVVAIVAGDYHCLALKSDLTVVAWGAGTNDSHQFPHYGQCILPPGLTNVVAISAGSGHSLALKADGTIVAWGAGLTAEGYPDYGQASVPARMAEVTALAAGGYHSLALEGSGTPRVCVQPAGTVVTNGHPAVLRALGSGSAPLDYQWLVNGTPIPGATASWLRLPAVTVAMATNKYSVLVSNANGSAVSSNADFMVVDQAPVISTQPYSQLQFVGALPRPVTLSVNGHGTSPMSYQWSSNGIPVPDATNSTLVLSPESVGTPANYTVILSNSAGARTSEVAAVGVVAPSGYPAAVVTDNPLAYWRLGERTGAVARDSWRGYDGAYLPSVTPNVRGALTDPTDPAVRFSGGTSGGYVEVPWTADLNVMPPFSVECWAKPETVVPSEAQAGCPLASIRRVGSAAQGWVLYQLPSGWNFRCGDGYATRLNIKGGGAPAVNTWYHLVVTYDGSTAILYINGQPAATGSTALYSPNPSVPLSIGARGDGYYRFAGVVDEVALYDQVLSAQRVLSHYEAAKTPAAPAALDMSAADGNLTLTWDAGAWRMQSADDPAGPYTDVPGLSSPWIVTPSGPQKFYRLRAAD